MTVEIDPNNTSRAAAFDLWSKAPNPMVTVTKTFDVTSIVKTSRKKRLKFNMLMCFCIGKAAVSVKEFYILPVGDKLIKYDTIAVNTIVKNKNGDINSCDIPFSHDLDTFNSDYLKYTSMCIDNCSDHDLSEDNMVIGTSAIVSTYLDSIVNAYSSVFNNPFITCGKFRKKFFRFYLPVSFQFHHAQMDGLQAGLFLENLQTEINNIRKA